MVFLLFFIVVVILVFPTEMQSQEQKKNIMTLFLWKTLSQRQQQYNESKKYFSLHNTSIIITYDF
jgi:hypothetical protein